MRVGTIKKAKRQRIDAFELWCWRRLLKVPWTTRRSNQSILKKSILNIRWKDYAEAPILWPPDVKGWLIRKDLDAGKGWRQEEKGTTEDEIVGWRHLLDEHEFEHALGVGDGKRSLESSSPQGNKELNITERLNWLNWNIFNMYICLCICYWMRNLCAKIFPLYYWLIFLFIVEFQDSLYNLAGRTLLHICFANIWDNQIDFSLVYEYLELH